MARQGCPHPSYTTCLTRHECHLSTIIPAQPVHWVCWVLKMPSLWSYGAFWSGCTATVSGSLWLGWDSTTWSLERSRAKSLNLALPPLGKSWRKSEKIQEFQWAVQERLPWKQFLSCLIYARMQKNNFIVIILIDRSRDFGTVEPDLPLLLCIHYKQICSITGQPGNKPQVWKCSN